MNDEVLEGGYRSTVKSTDGIEFHSMVGITFLKSGDRWEMNKDLEKFICGNWKAEGKCTAWINFFLIK